MRPKSAFDMADDDEADYMVRVEEGAAYALGEEKSGAFLMRLLRFLVTRPCQQAGHSRVSGACLCSGGDVWRCARYSYSEAERQLVR